MFFPLRDHNPTRKFATLTYGLILINIGTFITTLWYASAGIDWVVPAYGLIPRRFAADPLGELPTLFTSMFLHGDLLHLGTNLLFLHIFGDNVEDVLGKARYLAMYFGWGACAGLVQVGMDVNSAIPVVGASGAIAGVIGGYLLLYPRAPVLSLTTIPLFWFFMPILPVVPAWWIAGEFFLVNVLAALQIVGTGAASNVAVFAHLAGFASGVLSMIPVRQAGRSLRWRGFDRSLPTSGEDRTRWKRTRQLGP